MKKLAHRGNMEIAFKGKGKYQYLFFDKLQLNLNPEKGQFARNFLANFFKVSQERGCQFARIM